MLKFGVFSIISSIADVGVNKFKLLFVTKNEHCLNSTANNNDLHSG